MADSVQVYNLPESTILESCHDIFTTVFSAKSNKTRVRFFLVDKVLLESDYIWVVTCSCNLKICFNIRLQLRRHFVDFQMLMTSSPTQMALKTHLCSTSSHFVLLIECETSTAFSSDVISWGIGDWNRLFRIHESYLWFIIDICECKYWFLERIASIPKIFTDFVATKIARNQQK